MPVNTTPFNETIFTTPPKSLDAAGSPSITAGVGSPTTFPPNFPTEGNVYPIDIDDDGSPVIEQQKFLGATVRSFTTSAAWNEQSSTLTISLVEDKRAGDDFLLKEENGANYQGRLIGCPVSFTMGSFRFDGLILGFQQVNSFQGNPVFEVTLVSPVTILEGTQVILSNYVGPTNDSIFHAEQKTSSFQLSNVLNVYGYLENGGQNFGRSLANDTGLLWEGEVGVRRSIEILSSTNQLVYTNPNDNFGSFLAFRNHFYYIDFTALPTAPSFYRIGGSASMSVLEIVSAICEAAGVYYMACLEIGSGNGPHRIFFKIANLSSSTNLNTIGELIAGKLAEGTLIGGTVGQELRSSDFTQAMILGGEVATLYPEQNWSTFDPSVVPFWGFDANGAPITGSTGAGTFFADDDHAMNLNASEIADVIGAIGGAGIPGFSPANPLYPCTVLEMRCALVDYDSWATFLFIYKNDFAKAMGIYSAAAVNFGEDDLYQPQFVQDFVNDSVDLARQLGAMNDNTQWTTVSQRVYDYVRNQAETYYGRQFLVKLPFQIQMKVTPDSNLTIFSDEPTDAGFIPELSFPLGLNYINENFFLTTDGRMSPFFRFQLTSQFGSIAGSKIITANTSSLDQNAVVQYDQNIFNSYIFIGYGEPESSPVVQNDVLAGGKIVFIRANAVGFPVPAIVCQIPSPVFAQAADPLGGIEDVAAILNVPVASVAQAASFRSDSFPMRIHPPAFYPNGVTVAMKSNRYSYGPWGKFVTNGRCYFEQDTSLTPWEYGGFDNLNQGAIAKLATIQTGQQVKERGSYTHPGVPLASLGDVLIDGGPNVTNIDVTVDPDQGLTTNYSMETYIPRVGRFNDENASRLKRYGQLAQSMRRSIRQLFIEREKKQSVVNSVVKGFLQGASYAVQQKTPHAVMGGHLVYDPNTDGYYPMSYMQTYRESVANINAHNDEFFQQSACVGLDGLFRAVSTNINPSGGILSHYQPVRSEIISHTPITNSGIQPIRPSSDFYWFTHGDSYSHLNNKRSRADVSNARVMAHRGPMLMTGWGYDIAGKPVPNAAASGNDYLQKSTSSFKSGYLNHSQDWVTGAIDFHWDQMRSVWTIPTMLMGWVSGVTLAPYGSSKMAITFGDGVATGDVVDIHSFYGTPVETGVRVQTMYYPLENKHYIISANCASQS